MEEFSLGWMAGVLVALLVISGFFSIAETSMMAINRYRLKHMVAQGHGGAARVERLLRRTDKLLGAILIGNNVVNAAAACSSSGRAGSPMRRARSRFRFSSSCSPRSRPR
jgi:Mg2+/Co2+ transporter CorB